MATKILFKKSSTGGSTPATGDLDQGEFAVNLADRKVYTKDSSNNIVTLGTFVSSTAPTAPAEGDLWYDTTNNILKAYNGGSWDSLTSTTGTVTSVDITAGNLIDVSGGPVTSSGSIQVDVDLSELTDMTDAMVSTDEIVVLDAGAQKRKAASEIDLSIFDNTTSGFISSYTETQTLDDVTTLGNSTTNAITTGSITANGDVSVDSDLNVTGNAVITGNLTVSGTTTTVNSNQVNIGDSIILLNSDISDTDSSPTEDGGFSIKRGSLAAKTFKWNETDDKWDLGGETLQNVSLDGGTY